MAFKDLRSFLAKLEMEGQLVRYTDEVLPEPGIRALGRAAADLGPTGPAVLINNMKGCKGKQIVLNVHGSWANHALMLGMPRTASLKEQFHELDQRWPTTPGEVVYIDNPHCQEEVVEGDALNLLELLPVFKVNANDGGFYLSKASVVTKDLDDPDNLDKVNVGTYRVAILDATTLAMQGLPFHDVAIHLRKAEERNQLLPIAICLGSDPMLTFMSSTPLAYDQSEYRFAAAINGVPMELTRTLDGELPVPARAEFVIEGEILPRVRVPEGPFGEFPGSYSGARRQVMIKVKRVTHRQDPIFENLYLGRHWTEVDTLIGLNTSIPLYKVLRETMPEVKAVNAMYQHGLTAIIATDSRFGGYAKSVAFRVASTPHGISYVKNIIVVDGDVDPFDLNQVMWAMSTRIRGDKDVIVIPNTPGMPLDPGSNPPGMGCKVIIDCTTPVAPDNLMEDVVMIEHVPEAQRFQEVLAGLQAQAVAAAANK
ncbi:MAG: UbiD family decarboxylase [Desulfuromonadales bacterium]|nr:UbiD family decarboxylase [Desulfuromonadales bacterium]